MNRAGEFPPRGGIAIGAGRDMKTGGQGGAGIGRWAMALGLLALSACAGTDMSPAGGTTPSPSAATGAAAGAAGGPSVPAPRGGPPSATEQMVGLSDAEVAGLFGRPSLFRADSPAELWQYATADCVLLVFLREDAGGAARVLHAETQGIPPAQCLRRLMGRAANADARPDELAEAAPGA